LLLTSGCFCVKDAKGLVLLTTYSLGFKDPLLNEILFGKVWAKNGAKRTPAQPDRECAQKFV
jgi:hypothetical protein